MVEDDLLSPSIADAETAARSSARPWKLGSQFIVAFFGGPLAASLIGYLNMKRLGVTDRRGRDFVLVAVGGLALGGLATLAILSADFGSAARLGNQVAGVLMYGFTYRFQRSGDRVHQFYSDSSEDGAYDSLVGPGFAAVLGLGIPSVALCAGIAALFAS
jgi:hypothetical protein